MTHTPGPWVVSGYPPRILAPNNRGGAHAVSVAGVHKRREDHAYYPNWFGAPNPETVANGHLIAAAPDLLAALISTKALAEIKWGNLDPAATKVLDSASAAIAKARGQA